MDALISGYTQSRGNMFQTYADGRSADAEGASGSFARTILEQVTDETAAQDRTSRREMTTEEYKQYISQQIKQIPIHPSRRQENHFVYISEEGYAAMQKDPEYEAWVLNDLRSAWAQPGFYFGSADKIYTAVHYGATKEECHAETWRKPERNSVDNARERREEARRRMAKRIKKKLLQKQLRELLYQRQERQRAIVKKIIEHRREIEKENRQRWKKTAVKDKPDGSRVLETTTRQKHIEKVTERDILRVEEVLWEMQRQQEIQRQQQIQMQDLGSGLYIYSLMG